jgi:hypothetical protein
LLYIIIVNFHWYQLSIYHYYIVYWSNQSFLLINHLYSCIVLIISLSFPLSIHKFS